MVLPDRFIDPQHTHRPNSAEAGLTAKDIVRTVVEAAGTRYDQESRRPMIQLLALLGSLLFAASSQAAESAAARPDRWIGPGSDPGSCRPGRQTPFAQRYATLTPIVQQAFRP